MNVDVRELTTDDITALRDFFAAVPGEDHTFFKEDVNDPRVAERWVTDTRSIRRLAVDEDGGLVAWAALVPGVARTAHVAELLLVVAAPHRRQGLGERLARRMLVEALEHGYRKVSVYLAADNPGPIAMFRNLGFEPEALLRDQLRDPNGDLHDVMVLSHVVDERWAIMVTGGLDKAV
jgi:ribosomal protein S18 acetylase RimI-like enzyme